MISIAQKLFGRYLASKYTRVKSTRKHHESANLQAAVVNFVGSHTYAKNTSGTRNTLDCDQSNYSSRNVFPTYLLNLVKPEITPFDPATPKTPSYNQTRNTSNEPPRRYRNLNFPRWRPSRHLRFGETENSAIRSADPENPTVEPNMKWIGCSLAI